MILVNFASRSRPDKFFACLDNIREHFVEPYHVRAKLDNDDPCGKEAYSRLSDYQEVSVAWDLSSSKIDAINRHLTEDWGILLNHSDDMWFTVHGADRIIKDHMPEDLDCVLHFMDVNAPNLMTYSIIGRNYYLRDGYVYHPDYISLWCDNEAMQVAKMRGKYKFIPEPIFEHRHPVWQKAPYDIQYQVQGGYYRRDEQTYLRRQSINFDESNIL